MMIVQYATRSYNITLGKLVRDSLAAKREIDNDMKDSTPDQRNQALLERQMQLVDGYTGVSKRVKSNIKFMLCLGGM